MELTVTEIDILSHRLECPGNIAECIDATEDDVEQCAASLLARMSQSHNLPDTLTDLERRVLIDCLDRSTYATSCAMSSDDDSPELRRAIWDGRALCRKLAKPLGRLVAFPAY